ncbi:hypothetical protein GCM10011575_01950 [Microlunatus endophyticus]|uniref:Uncharacterized protein n=1 Tax=Microlunatus endophyticus TaxID=1716077 RepID=A0A917VZ54_9ACTN|nr:hypothetical protein GCM10011575_01950 [Microlunatus endophyticus]
MLDLLDQAGECLGITDRTVVHPGLVAHPPLAYRLQVRLGLGLGQFQVRDPGFGRDQIRISGTALGGQFRQLGMLGKIRPAMLQLGDRGVDGLQVEQPELGRVIGLDESALRDSDVHCSR